MQGLVILNKHSYYDYGAIMTSRNIGYPKEIKITERVPFSNIIYDFSYLHNGGKCYEERTLVYELSISEHGVKNRRKLNFRAGEIVNWLQYEKGKIKVVDTYTPEYHFMAECSDVEVVYESGIARITVAFTAEPFRIPNEINSGLEKIK